MKTLTSYKKNGFQWNVCQRRGDVAVFASDCFRFFEVIVIQSHNGREIAGNYCPPAEFPPSNEQWGVKGWSYSNALEANNKFEEICQKEEYKKITISLHTSV